MNKVKKKKVIITAIMVCVIAVIVWLYVKHDDIKGGFAYTMEPKPIMIGVKSNEDTFNVNDVNVDLYYAFYENKEEEAGKYSYVQEPSDEVILGMYISNLNDPNKIIKMYKMPYYEDYKKLPGETFIKEITEDEAFDEDYSYGYSHILGRMLYKHHEKISIPSYLLENEEGEILIRLVSFIEPNERCDKYDFRRTAYVVLGYKYIDEDTVKLEFKETSN